MKRLAIVSTHPIQYNAPWFKMLTEQNKIKLKVFYTWSQRQYDFFDKDFGQEIKWDIPLLDGYNYTFVSNTAKKPGNKSFWGIKTPSLISEVREFEPTHILIFGWNYHAHFKAMSYFKGKIPVLFRGDSTLLDYDFQNFGSVLKSIKKVNIITSSRRYLKFLIRKSVLSYIYRHIDKALYVGTNNKEYFRTHGIKPNQLVFVPHAIDNDRFKDRLERDEKFLAAEWRTNLGIKKNDFVILYAGKLESKKGPVILIEAFKQLNEQIPNAKLIIIGNGPLEDEVNKLIIHNNNIQLLPFQNQSRMPLVYRLANVFCLPSKGPGETWGLAVNEALASGVPVVVSSKVGCAIDLATPGHGCTFEAGNIIELNKGLINVHNNIKNGVYKEFLMKDWSFKKLTRNLTDCLINS